MISLTSKVWQHFIKTENGGECKYCSRELKAAKGNTSNLHSHLRLKHGILTRIKESPDRSSDALKTETILCSDGNTEEIEIVVKNNEMKIVYDGMESTESEEKMKREDPNSVLRRTSFRSTVWQHFDKTINGGRCKYCSKDIKASKGNTTNLNSHLKCKHSDLVKEDKSESRPIESYLVSQKSSNDKVVKIIKMEEHSKDDEGEEEDGHSESQYNTSTEDNIEFIDVSHVRRNSVWKHFVKTDSGGFCKYCSKNIISKQGSTMRLLEHVKSKHSEIYKRKSETDCESFVISQYEGQDKKPRLSQLKSNVWLHFTKNAVGGLCKYCHKEIKARSGNTTNLKNHLKTRHPQEAAEQDLDEKRMLVKSIDLDENTVECFVNTASTTEGMDEQEVDDEEGVEEVILDVEEQKTKSKGERLETKSLITESNGSSIRSPRSSVWQHFNKIEGGGECQYCLKVIKTQKGNTTNLNNHYKLKHAPIPSTTAVESEAESLERYIVIEEYDMDENEVVDDDNVDVEYTDEIEYIEGYSEGQLIQDAIINFFVQENLPLNIVERDPFQHLVKTLNSEAEIPSRHALARKMKNYMLSTI